MFRYNNALDASVGRREQRTPNNILLLWRCDEQRTPNNMLLLW